MAMIINGKVFALRRPDDGIDYTRGVAVLQGSIEARCVSQSICISNRATAPL